MMFVVGDIIKGKPNDYGVTNENMYKARVRKVEKTYMDIKILDHRNSEWINEEFTVLNSDKDFELVESKIVKDYSATEITEGKLEELTEKIKNMGFDGVGSVQTTTPFTCSKKRNAPKRCVFLFGR